MLLKGQLTEHLVASHLVRALNLDLGVTGQRWNEPVLESTHDDIELGDLVRVTNCLDKSLSDGSESVVNHTEDTLQVLCQLVVNLEFRATITGADTLD